jgi:tetratricopeptide (TPR) repeat protein
MSKPSIITLPFVMILLDYWPLHRFPLEESHLSLFKRQFREKAIFFLLALVFALVTVWVQPAVSHFPFSDRIANAVVSLMIYLQKAFFPFDLAVFYPFPKNIPVWKVIGASALVTIMTISALTMRKRYPYFFVGWLWYCITILPFLGIMQVGNHARADRYTYLPLIGIGIILAWATSVIFRNIFAPEKKLRFFSVLFLAMLAMISWKQCSYWRNDKNLFMHALRVTNDNYFAHICLGMVFQNEGAHKEAIAHCREAIRIKPRYANSYNCRGSIYYQLGQYEKALQDCRQAIRVQPDYAESYYYEGLTYHQLKKYHLALQSFEKALSLTPDRADFHIAKGNSHLALKEYQAALDEYSMAIQMKPDYAEAFLNRGIIDLARGNRSAGCADLRKSCNLGLCRGLKWARENQYCLSTND